jgi:hypothetical protein
LQKLFILLEQNAADRVRFRSRSFMNFGQELFGDRTLGRFFNLLGGVDGNVAEAQELAAQSALIDIVAGADEPQLFPRRRIGIPIAVDHANTAFGAGRQTVARRTDRNALFMSQIHDALALLDLEFDFLRNELHFHVTSPARGRISFCPP